MRDELKKLLNTTNELSIDDFDYTLRTAKHFARSTGAIPPEDEARARLELKHSPDDLMIVLDDMAYYRMIETQYIWHYCLWRLQAVLEGMITGKFLRDHVSGPLLGLKSKREAMQRAGYTVEQADFDELIDWGRLRNVLSHHPPHSDFPGPLDEPDVEEYANLAKRMCQNWFNESPLSTSVA